MDKHVPNYQQTGVRYRIGLATSNRHNPLTWCPVNFNGNTPIQTQPHNSKTGTPLQIWCPGNLTGTHQHKLAWHLQTGTTDKLRYPATANGYTVTTPVHHIKMALPQHCSSNTAAMYTWPAKRLQKGGREGEK
eukprot:scpid29319/ scgid10396/ 